MVSILSQEPSGVSHSGKTSVDRLLSNFSMGYFPAQIFHHFPFPSLLNEAKKRCATLEKAMQGGATKTNHLHFEKTRQDNP